MNTNVFFFFFEKFAYESFLSDLLVLPQINGDITTGFVVSRGYTTSLFKKIAPFQKHNGIYLYKLHTRYSNLFSPFFCFSDWMTAISNTVSQLIVLGNFILKTV